MDSDSRDKEKFVCTNCGFIADADNQASINIGMKGINILGISPNKLLRVPEKVTAKPESTGSSFREKSIALAVEPSNPNPPPKLKGEASIHSPFA